MADEYYDDGTHWPLRDKWHSCNKRYVIAAKAYICLKCGKIIEKTRAVPVPELIKKEKFIKTVIHKEIDKR